MGLEEEPQISDSRILTYQFTDEILKAVCYVSCGASKLGLVLLVLFTK